MISMQLLRQIPCHGAPEGELPMPIARRRAAPIVTSRSAAGGSVPQAAAQDGGRADVQALTRAYNASGQALFREFSAGPGNIVFSPYSIGTAMAMVLAGARGETEREMVDGAPARPRACADQRRQCVGDRDPQRLRQERGAADLSAGLRLAGERCEGSPRREAAVRFRRTAMAKSASRPRGFRRRRSCSSPMR